MSLTFEIKGALAEHAIRHIVREAEAGMADGADAKVALVAAAQNHLAEQHAHDIATMLNDAKDTAEMIGGEVDIPTALADVKAQIGAEFDKIVDSYRNGEIGETLAETLAKAAVLSKPVMPMNRGKWLSKLGIVKAHIDALVPATTTPGTHGSPELDADAAKLTALGADPGPTDAELAAMLGLDVPEVPAPPPFVAASADGAAPLPPMSAGAPSAAPPGHDVPPPPAVNPRDAFVLFGEAMEVDDAEMAKRLGVSRSTVHNYTKGKTAKVKVTLAQARAMVAEIDMRTAKLRQAADIFSQVRD